MSSHVEDCKGPIEAEILSKLSYIRGIRLTRGFLVQCSNVLIIQAELQQNSGVLFRHAGKGSSDETRLDDSARAANSKLKQNLIKPAIPTLPNTGRLFVIEPYAYNKHFKFTPIRPQNERKYLLPVHYWCGSLNLSDKLYNSIELNCFKAIWSYPLLGCYLDGNNSTV